MEFGWVDDLKQPDHYEIRGTRDGNTTRLGEENSEKGSFLMS
jgi:hypothetical protein